MGAGPGRAKTAGRPRGKRAKQSHFADTADPGTPAPRGMYDPSLDKDACGVGFIADIKGRKSHQMVEDALAILCNLEHRGAVGADPRAGDGAGILVQIPHAFFAKKTDHLGFKLPEPGEYAVGQLFMPRDPDWRQIIRDIYAQTIKREGMVLLGWRDVPKDNSTLGESVKPTEPMHQQVFIGRGKKIKDADEFERRLYMLRKLISQKIYSRRERRLSGYYPVSISCRTVVYKGMFLADQLGTYYPDLHDPDFVSALALVHQRFSTNTFPTWSLAHPYRMIAHNGEINTLRGNNNWMAARQASVSSPLFGDDIEKLWPISYEGQSDTACFDNALEFLVQGGYPLAHAVMMMIPEAWAGNPLMDEERRAFYEYNAALMEPWDGPAAIAFTNGRQIGATLDRNGLRPARYFVTRDDRIIMASEMGVLPIPEKDIVTKWRLQPGKMLLVDLEQGRLIPDEELKSTLAKSHPYKEWLERTQIVLEDLPAAATEATLSNLPLLDRQQAFGYTQEDLRILMSPMATTGEEAVGSMGNDAPISALSDKPKLLFTYFKQNFAQVTNPPIDPIREELVMSLVSIIGPRPNLFDLEGVSRTKRLEVRQPILTNEDLEKIRSISEVGDGHFKSRFLDTTWPAEHGPAGLKDGLDALCARAEAAVREGINILILSDRRAGTDQIPMPSLLACAAVHHHLIRQGLRTSVGLVVESGEPREVHHFACLAGYGAEAINPYLAFETLIEMKGEMQLKGDAYRGRQEVHQVDRQGPAQGDVQDGHLDLPVLLRRADFRRGRSQVGVRRRILHRHRHPDRGRRPAAGGRGMRAPPPRRVRRCADLQECARRRRRVPVPRPRRGSRLDRRHRDGAAARGARQPARPVPRLCQGLERAVGAALHHPRPVPAALGGGRRPQAGAARGGRAGCRDRQAVRDRRHVVRLDFARSAHHAGDRDEPDRRQVEHRRGRRGERPLQAAAEWRLDALGDQAGGVRPLRRHRRVSGQLGHDADQDGAGRQARRRRAIARPQGRQDHRQGTPLDAGRRADLPAAAPRHLFDRGSGAADLRPEERQPGRRGVGEARLRGRRRHGRGRRLQGARRPRHDLGLRGRHRRLAADLDQARRLALGDRACRNAPDAGREPAARPHRRAGRWRHPHRPRRGGGRAAWAPTSSASRPRR